MQTSDYLLSGDPHALWSKIVVEVQSANKNAGTLNTENISLDVRDAFKKRPAHTIPNALLQQEETGQDVHPIATEYPLELALACVVGSWCESDDFNADKVAIEAMTGNEYSEWIAKIRDILLQPATPLKLTDGRWAVIKRREIWDTLGPK